MPCTPNRAVMSIWLGDATKIKPLISFSLSDDPSALSADPDGPVRPD